MQLYTAVVLVACKWRSPPFATLILNKINMVPHWNWHYVVVEMYM